MGRPSSTAYQRKLERVSAPTRKVSVHRVAVGEELHAAQHPTGQSQYNTSILGLLLWFGIGALTIVFSGVILLILLSSSTSAADRSIVTEIDRMAL